MNYTLRDSRHFQIFLFCFVCKHTHTHTHLHEQSTQRNSIGATETTDERLHLPRSFPRSDTPVCHEPRKEETERWLPYRLAPAVSGLLSSFRAVPRTQREPEGLPPGCFVFCRVSGIGGDRPGRRRSLHARASSNGNGLVRARPSPLLVAPAISLGGRNAVPKASPHNAHRLMTDGSDDSSAHSFNHSLGHHGKVSCGCMPGWIERKQKTVAFRFYHENTSCYKTVVPLSTSV